MSDLIQSSPLMTTISDPGGAARRHPVWLRRPIPTAGKRAAVEAVLAQDRLHTVCVEARCPNRGECFGRGVATFLILGDTCTRDCAFCAIAHGVPNSVDPDEPERICRAIETLALEYVVITSVTRDDCSDGGAAHYAATITKLKKRIPGMRVEVLVPDFGGSATALETVLASKPDVLSHNIETVPRLYPQIRKGADYERSLTLLGRAARQTIAKSGFMLGLGESDAEVLATMRDLRAAGVSALFIGQYLQPSARQTPVQRFVSPSEFEQLERVARAMGFAWVFSGPFVRSSYRAREIFARQSSNYNKQDLDSPSNLCAEEDLCR
jgi:lipoic acid synthetase